jgi:hypothetical protein
MEKSVVWGGDLGIRRNSGSITLKDVYSKSGSADFTGTITKTNCAAPTTTGTGITTISEADFGMLVRRHPDMIAAGTFENEPSITPGKIARCALYREEGTCLGIHGGNSSIVNGLLIGTTGGLVYPAAPLKSVNSMTPAVRATFPALATSRGLYQQKATGDNINRLDSLIDTDGIHRADVYDNAAVMTPFSPLVMGNGDVEFYKDFADNLAAANYRKGGLDRTGSLSGGTISGGALLCDANSEYLGYNTFGAAAQAPGQAGAMVLDSDVPATIASHQNAFDLKPNSASSSNRVAIYKRSTTGKCALAIRNSGGTEALLETAAEVTAGRKVLTAAWKGYAGGAGTAERYLGVDGGAPVSATGDTLTRTEVVATGTITLGSDASRGTEEWGGNIYRAVVFRTATPTVNGNLYDLTAAYDAAALWADLAVEYAAYQAAVAAYLAAYSDGAAHTYAIRVHAGVVAFFLDDMENPISTQPYAGTRDATDTHQIMIGGGSTFFLGTEGSASSWAVNRGNADAPELPMPYYADEEGMCEDFGWSDRTHPTMVSGGTVAGSPELDITGYPLLSPDGTVPLGPFAKRRLVSSRAEVATGIVYFDSRDTYSAVIGNGIDYY